MAVEDIIIGPAWAWYAPVSEANPDETTVDFGTDWGGNWSPLGYIQEGQTISWNREVERYEVGAAQLAVVLKRVNQKETLALETTLIELSGDVLGLALDTTPVNTPAAAGQHGMDELQGGGKIFPSAYKFGFEGVFIHSSGTKLPVRFFLHKGNAMLGGALEFGKQGETGISFHVDALGDLGQAEDEYLYHIQIVNVPKTS